MKIVYVCPHQDDEVLTYGPSILEDVQSGHEVIVVLATRGQASSARTNPALIARVGYTPTEAQFSAARDREFILAVERMGATPLVASYASREPDGGSVLANVIALVKAQVPGGADLVCGIGAADPALDHRNTGFAAEALYAEGWAAGVRIHFPYYFVASHHVAPALRLRGIPMTYEYQRAYIEYDVPNGYWGVGYISVKSLFDNHLADPLSYYYAPAAYVTPPSVGAFRTGSGTVVTMRTSGGLVLPVGH